MKCKPSHIILAAALGAAVGAACARREVLVTVEQLGAAIPPPQTGAIEPRKEALMRQWIYNARRKLVVAMTCGIVAVGSLAMAAWVTDSVPGPWSGRIGTAQKLQITALVPTSGDLLPGGKGALTATVQNPNSYAVALTSVSITGAPTAGQGASSNCNSSTLATNLTASPTVMVTDTIPANSSKDVTLPNAVTASTQLPTDCQGVAYSFTGTAHSG